MGRPYAGTATVYSSPRLDLSQLRKAGFFTSNAEVRGEWTWSNGDAVTIVTKRNKAEVYMELINEKAAGYYTNYISIISIFTIVIGPVLALIFPITTELIIKKDTNKLSLLQNLLYKYASLFALSIS